MQKNQRIRGIGRLGREIKISPKANVTLNLPGYKVEYFEETIEVLIGIGKDNSATLTMTREAWRALQEGHEIKIDTNKAIE